MTDIDDAPFTIEELTALALDGDPDTQLAPDAQPLALRAASTEVALLPEWYMPAALARLNPGWRRWTVVGIVGLLLGIEVCGLCSVFGQLVIG